MFISKHTLYQYIKVIFMNTNLRFKGTARGYSGNAGDLNKDFDDYVKEKKGFCR